MKGFHFLEQKKTFFYAIFTMKAFRKIHNIPLWTMNFLLWHWVFQLLTHCQAGRSSRYTDRSIAREVFRSTISIDTVGRVMNHDCFLKNRHFRKILNCLMYVMVQKNFIGLRIIEIYQDIYFENRGCKCLVPNLYIWQSETFNIYNLAERQIFQ